MIKQITIIGTGLIGGSLGLALKRHGFAGCIIGCDREHALAKAHRSGAIDRGELEAIRACEGSELIVLATPVGAIIDLIEKLGPLLPAQTLITDTGSTKMEISARARQVFGEAASRRFLGGHPMAGKEHGGVEHADAELFAGATWVLTPPEGANAAVAPQFTQGLHGEFVRLLTAIGANIVMIPPERHDRLCAYLSHLPQMISTALAACVVEQIGTDTAREMMAGRAFREITRVAASPYSMWRDIALTNTGNLHDVLLQFEQQLAHIRENLRTRELQEMFDRAHELFKPPKPKDDFEPPRF